MPQVALAHATIDYRVLGPEDSPHPPVVFVHGVLVDSRLWDRVAEGLAGRGSVATCPTGRWARTPFPSMTAPTCRRVASRR